ncbi:hypothetical protein Back11_31160 [Paenibacillus baekrokdamisoli]|uniref:Uncharacterized protein n=1 Tax=Paenibacillus baekrokdamisoli TaxID=1712516 RepID=A0A3G9J7K7_9BACL|nr:hypothetical protein [Paenibacillus baekrokdamisoli]MBB3071720.1 hypothetical protein [Paenibacillus baekrokdamisoli]BBH21771.1 hypothetical protein Back11_31160 [Paenibacillus baekrokdamisoli]
MKAANGWSILLILVLLFAAGCKNTEPEVEKPDPMFPVMERVKSVAVTNDEGTEVLANLENEEVIAALLLGLHDAVPSYIEDPEPSGKLLKVKMTNESATQTYTVNDLRETDSLDYSVKIYVDNSDGPSRAWVLPTAWARLLLGYDSSMNEEPLLYASVNTLSNSVVVQSNRNMNRDSVDKAIKDTLVTSMMETNDQLDYHIYWSDPQRFVIRFAKVGEGNSLLFRLDGVMAETGESFASKSQPFRNQVIVYGKSSGLRWVNTNREIEREQKYDSAVLIQPIWSDNQQDSLLVYHHNDSQSLIKLSTGDIHAMNLTEWPQLKKGYGNDYGTGVLYADRFTSGMSYAVKENKTVYRVNSRTGEASKLYVSEKPIYGIAASPDNKRVAILVSSDSIISSFADLIVLNSLGKEIFRKNKASFSGHSDGFLFVYPISWLDNHRIGVIFQGKGDEEFLRGKAYINIEDASMKKEADVSLPDEAMQLLENYIGGTDAEILRVLPNPSGEKERYYAVQIAATGIWLIDVISHKVSWLGPGTLIQWNDLGEVVLWHSQDSIAFIGL